jgi:hypothetical protein
MNEQRIIFKHVGLIAETCEYGCPHEVGYAEVKKVTDTGQKRMHDNGYEQRMTPLFTDAQGRIYHQHVTIDFANNTYFIRDGDKAYFAPRGQRPLTRDITGRGIGNCPDGPAWKG